MNAKIDLERDRHVQPKNKTNNPYTEFLALIKDNNLKDAFENNPENIDFTWEGIVHPRGATDSYKQKTRIDWFLIPKNIEEELRLSTTANTIKIKKGTIKDHKPITLEMEFEVMSLNIEKHIDQEKRELIDLDEDEIGKILKSDKYIENGLLNTHASVIEGIELTDKNALIQAIEFIKIWTTETINILQDEIKERIKIHTQQIKEDKMKKRPH
jgi:hypothetical protein